MFSTGIVLNLASFFLSIGPECICGSQVDYDAYTVFGWAEEIEVGGLFRRAFV